MLAPVIKTPGSCVAPNRVEVASAHFSPGESGRRKIRDLCRQAWQSLDMCVHTISEDQLNSEILACRQRGIAARVITDNEKIRYGQRY